MQKCPNLDKKLLKLMAKGKYKANKKFINYLKKHVKESLNESENYDLIDYFRNWVMNTIDSWIQSYDNIDDDLDTADDYFSNNFDEFLSEYGYEDSGIDDLTDEMLDIIYNYVESTKEYLENKYSDEW